MAVTVINRNGKAQDPTEEGKKIPYTYRKIVTPATKRGSEDKDKGEVQSSYPSLAELVQYLEGKVEFELDENGQPKSSCLVQYAIDGWNLEENKNAMFKALNTPAVAIAKVNEQIAEMAKKFNMSVEDFKAMLAAK